MGLIAKSKGGGSMKPVSEGMHHGICYGIWDIGTHYKERHSKWVHECIIVWELPEERGVFDGKDLPRAISNKYTVSLSQKAILRKTLETWRGRAFTEEELTGFDIKNVLGANCYVQVIHNKKDDKTYANIVGVTPLPKGTAKREPENPVKFFSFEDGTNIPDGTPDWIADQIKSAKEWGGGATQPDDEAPPPEDDIPF